MIYFIANWKQYTTHQETISWCTKNLKKLTQYSSYITIVICPSFDSLNPAHSLLAQTNIKLGAQNCSAYTSGAYTGEVGALSLYEIGCTYCIIGHSERYKLFGEKPEAVAQKALLLLQNNITPIICVNENNPEEQLSIISHALKKNTSNYKKVIIAYEPTWAIGSGETPDNTSIENTITLFKNKLQNVHNYSIEYVYGGSVSESTINTLRMLDNVNGFLVGKASTNINQTISILNSMQQKK